MYTLLKCSRVRGTHGLKQPALKLPMLLMHLIQGHRVTSLIGYASVGVCLWLRWLACNMALRVHGALGDLAHRLLHVQVVSRLQRVVHRRSRRRHQ